MPINQHTDPVEEAISELRNIPEGMGRGLESEVAARLQRAETSSASIIAPVFASAIGLVLVVAGVGVGLLRGHLYEQEIRTEFEEGYVATIHPIVAVSVPVEQGE